MICSLLAVELLLIQGIGAVHCHAGEPDECVPHIHCGLLFSWLTPAPHDAMAASDANGCPHCTPAPADDHDDAVHVPGLFEADQGVARVPICPSPVTDLAGPAVPVSVASVHSSESLLPQPFPGRYHCPIFLQTLALLI